MIFFLQFRYQGWIVESISKCRQPNWQLACIFTGRGLQTGRVLQTGSPPTDRKISIFEERKSRDFYISNMRKHTGIRQLVSSIFKIGGTLKHFLVNAQSFLQSCKGQFRTKMMGCRRVNTATRWSCQNAQYVVQSMGCPHPLSEISLPRLQFKICRWASLSLKQFQRYKWMVFKSWQWNLVSFGRNIRQGFEIYNNPGRIVFPSLSSIRVQIVFN